MLCSPRSSTGCCTCQAQAGRTEQTLGLWPRPPSARSAPHSQESQGTGGLGVSGHLELQPDQVCSSSSLSTLPACSRGLYGSPVPAGAKVTSAPHPEPLTVQFQCLWFTGSSSTHVLLLGQPPPSTVPRALKFQSLFLSFHWGPFPGWRSLQEMGKCFPSPASLSPLIKQGRRL